MLLVYCCVHKFYTRSYIELQRIDAVSPFAFGIGFAVSLNQALSCTSLLLWKGGGPPDRIYRNVLKLQRVKPGLHGWNLLCFAHRSPARRCIPILQRAWLAWTRLEPTATRAGLH